MSDDWLQSKLQTEPCFMLEFTDKQQLLMSRTKLEALCNALPALPFLLFGHPSMKEKVAERRSDNGIMVLTLMGVDLSLERFLSMMNVVLGVTELPAEKHDIDSLLNVVNLLGGCDQIEKALRTRKRPRCPDQDVNDEFEWKQVMVESGTYAFRKMSENYQEWLDQGWCPVDDIRIHQSGGKHCGHVCTNFLRRRKRAKHTTDSPNN